MDFYGNPWYGQPRRHKWAAQKGHRRAKRNPLSSTAMKGTFKEWTQGLTVTDIVAATAGFAASAMIPGMLITSTDTTMKKALKVAAAVVSALAVGAAAKSFVGSKAGQCAAIGGLAGATGQAISSFTPWKIGGMGNMALPVGRSIGRYPAPASHTPFQGARLV